jgi:hypothetical protein
MERIWEWQGSEEFRESDSDDVDPLVANPWWEDMVEMLLQEFGRLNLA